MPVEERKIDKIINDLNAINDLISQNDKLSKMKTNKIRSGRNDQLEGCQDKIDTNDRRIETLEKNIKDNFSSFIKDCVNEEHQIKELVKEILLNKLRKLWWKAKSQRRAEIEKNAEWIKQL